MKRIFTSLCFILLILVAPKEYLFAQAPEGIIYQAEARNSQGEILSNKAIKIKISIYEGSVNGSVVWEADHDVITNNYGTFVLVIGTGENLSGYAFEDIKWENQTHFLNVKIKEEKSGVWYDMGTSQFLSVPYALHAKTASYLVEPKEKNGKIPGVNSQTWSLFGNSNTDPTKDMLGTTDENDVIFVSNNTERLRIFSDGNIDIQEVLKVKNNLIAEQNVFLNTEGGVTTNYGAFSVAQNSPTSLSGTLDVSDNTNLMGHLQVGGNSDLAQNLTVQGSTNLNNILNVNNGFKTYLTGDLDVDGNMKVLGTSSFNNLNVNGELNVAGKSTLNDVSVGGKLDVTGATVLNNTLSAKGQVTIDANLDGDQGNYANYPLRVEGGKHGIAIKVNSLVPSRNDNFISFMSRDETILGRVEGMYGVSGNIASWIVNLLEPGPTPSLNDVSGDVDYSQQPDKMELEGIDLTSNNVVDAISHGIDFAKSVVVFGVNCIGALAGAAVLGDIDDVVWSGVDVIAETIQFSVWFIFEANFNGVAFESGGADYAEWLEKKDINEIFSFGEVVGVNGGLISKDFKKAEKYMVISHNPTVIGAMPDSANAKKYERIAFMGQVPVKVIGKVEKGDYILPSGNQDGMAIAVAPKNMATGDYARIIGTAWGESDGKELFSYINTAVGINSNDLVNVIEKMQGMMNDMQLAIAEVNPNYTPQLYAVNGESNQSASDITTSPGANSLLAKNSGAFEAQTVEEAIQKIKDYAYLNNPNLDLSSYPYLAEMFENPTLETAEAMVDHYQGVLNKLMAVMPDTKK